jgi:DNA-binding NarL/FixJ family response regulator
MLASIPGTALVGHAEGAREAIDGILAAKPDAVVLDLSLKEGNGFDVMREVARSAPQIAFYILTNHPVDAFRATARRLGARGFFDKSTEFEQLRSVIAAAA